MEMGDACVSKLKAAANSMSILVLLAVDVDPCYRAWPTLVLGSQNDGDRECKPFWVALHSQTNPLDR